MNTCGAVCLSLAVVVTLTSHQSANAEPVSVDFTTDLQADFTYVDALQSPFDAASMIFSSALNEGPMAVSSRTLGLSRLRSVMAWRLSGRNEFIAVLRPDALLRPSISEFEVVASDFDTRAGKMGSPGAPYRYSPRIKLVDAYEARYLAGDQFRIGVGVRENIERDFVDSSPNLKFGLTVQMPHHLNHLGMSWTYKDQRGGLQPGVKSTRTDIQLSVIHGRSDRGDRFEYDVMSDDYAPAAEDPYLGLMIEADWLLGQQWKAGFIAGYRGNADESGVVNETFAQMHAARWTRWLEWPIVATLDLRYGLESWRSGERKDLVQQSMALSGSTLLSPGHRVGTGFHMGTSDRHSLSEFNDDNYLVDGYQIDLAYTREFHEGLALVVSVAHEHRQVITGGVHQGAFGDADEAAPSFRKRFAIEINYQSGSVR